MILAKPEIIAAYYRGDILLEPFSSDNVRNSSYDVTLGEWYWLETIPEPIGETCVIPTARDVFAADQGVILNPYDEQSVRRMWGPEPLQALPLTQDLPGIPKGSKIIALHPGQNALCCTEQFIGTSDMIHTTKMLARSSIGRNQVTICRCAGGGDIGFAYRWTMEISNAGNRTVLLVVGRRVAQLWFMGTTGLKNINDSYEVSGKYQSGSTKGKTLAELEASWSPDDMLPKMWLDHEVINLEPAK